MRLMMCRVPSSVGMDNHTSTSSPMALTWVTVPSDERSLMDEVSRSDAFMGMTLHEGWYMSRGVMMMSDVKRVGLPV